MDNNKQTATKRPRIKMTSSRIISYLYLLLEHVQNLLHSIQSIQYNQRSNLKPFNQNSLNQQSQEQKAQPQSRPHSLLS